MAVYRPGLGTCRTGRPPVRARPGRSRGLGVSHSTSDFYGALVWVRAYTRSARHGQNRRFPVRAAVLRSLGHTPGSNALCSGERAWAAAGVGRTLSGSGAAAAAGGATAAGGGRVDGKVSELELRRARMAAAAEARFEAGLALSQKYSLGPGDLFFSW
jgi:hypothetical protein